MGLFSLKTQKIYKYIRVFTFRNKVGINFNRAACHMEPLLQVWAVIFVYIRMIYRCVSIGWHWIHITYWYCSGNIGSTKNILQVIVFQWLNPPKNPGITAPFLRITGSYLIWYNPLVCNNQLMALHLLLMANSGRINDSEISVPNTAK